MFYLRFLLVLLLLAACGPTTHPDDLAARQSTAPVATLIAPAPALTHAGTPLSLPLIVQQAGYTPSSTASLPAPPASPTSLPPTPETTLRIAVIGDYGGGGIPEADVANLVLGWAPDLIITTGDNNYPDGSDVTIDANIGQFYHTYIYPYLGAYGEDDKPGTGQNRFFPTLGNHDWNTDSAQPYLDYFTLPGNERYYDFTWGPVHFFALDSDSREPDGVGRSSDQAAWLQQALGESTAPWQLVYLHHAPYSSGYHGGTDWAVWPYAEWGADAVLAGHDHTYERLLIDGILYFVNGVGGGAIYAFVNVVQGSQFRYNDDYGAMLVEANTTSMTFSFFDRGGELIDTYTIAQP